MLPKRLLEGLRIPEVTLDLGPKMPLGRVGLAPPFPVGGLKPTLPGTVVLIGLLAVGGLERFVVVAGWVGLAGAATLLGVLLTLGNGLGLGEAGRLAAGWVVRLPPSALLLLLCAEIGLTNNVKTKASAIPTCANLKFAVLYLPVNMAGLLNYVQPLSLYSKGTKLLPGNRNSARATTVRQRIEKCTLFLFTKFHYPDKLRHWVKNLSAPAPVFCQAAGRLPAEDAGADGLMGGEYGEGSRFPVDEIAR